MLINLKVGHLYTRYKSGDSIVIFLSGYGDFPSYENFLPLISRLDSNFGYLTIDYPNSGESSTRNQVGLGLSDLVESFMTIVNFYNVKDYIICAHSMGGVIASRLVNHLSGKNCKGLLLIEPTTFSVLFGDLTKNPYPEFLALQEHIQSYADSMDYFRELSSKSMTTEESQILLEKQYQSANRLVKEDVNFQKNCCIEAEEISKISLPNELPIYIVTQSFRLNEYRYSEYFNDKTEIISIGTNHYLHWTEAEVISNLLKLLLE